MIAWKSGGRQGNTWCPPLSMPCRAVRKHGGFPPFTPAASIVQERTRPGNNPRPGAPAKGAPGHPYTKKREAPPCLGPSGGWRPCGARKARYFTPEKTLKNGPLRYALTERDGGTRNHTPPKGGEAGKINEETRLKKRNPPPGGKRNRRSHPAGGGKGGAAGGWNR